MFIYILPKWADSEKSTFLQSIKIIDYRMRNNNSDNMKPETLNIDKLIEEKKMINIFQKKKINSCIIDMDIKRTPTKNIDEITI
jgi:hypothetical protein